MLTFPHDPLTRSRRVDRRGHEVAGRPGHRAAPDRRRRRAHRGLPARASTERLGIGPDVCLARNPRLVYGRITGWGQDGPLAQAAGHDINYIGLAGALEPIGRAGERPVPPLNLLGDFGGGGMLLAMGVLAALVERASSGRGQVVDASMVDGAALLTAGHARAAQHRPVEQGPRRQHARRRRPVLRHLRDADGKYVAVGAIEERFWGDLLKVLELDPAAVAGRLDPDAVARGAARARRRCSRTRTRDEWAARAEGTDACLTAGAHARGGGDHPHNVARGTFVRLDGHRQPAPAPEVRPHRDGHAAARRTSPGRTPLRC